MAVFSPASRYCDPYLLHGTLYSLSIYLLVDRMGMVVCHSRALWYHQVHTLLSHLHLHHLAPQQIVYTLENLKSSILTAVTMLYPVATNILTAVTMLYPV